MWSALRLRRQLLPKISTLTADWTCLALRLRSLANLGPMVFQQQIRPLPRVERFGEFRRHCLPCSAVASRVILVLTTKQNALRHGRASRWHRRYCREPCKQENFVCAGIANDRKFLQRFFREANPFACFFLFFLQQLSERPLQVAAEFFIHSLCDRLQAFRAQFWHNSAEVHQFCKLCF